MTKESSSALREPHSKKEKQVRNDIEDREDDKDVERQIKRDINECRRLYMSPLMSDATRQQYEDMFEDLRSKEDGARMIHENIGLLHQTLSKAESYRNDFSRTLDNAVAQKWISVQDRSKFWDKFDDPNLVEFRRGEWVKDGFREIMASCREVAEKRERVLAKAKRMNVTAKDIPALATIENDDAFLSLHHLKRKNLLSEVRAAIVANEKERGRLVSFMKAELTEWAELGFLHKTDIGKWMERAMDADDPEAYLAQTLYPLKKKWEAVRRDYDSIHAELNSRGIPRGFRPVSESKFLLMSDEQRASYCTMVKERLNQEQIENKRLADAKLRARHFVDVEDWEGAEETLASALAEWPNDAEFRAMKDYVTFHKPEEKVKNEEETKAQQDPVVILGEARSMIEQIPSEDLKYMVGGAANRGAKVLERMMQLVTNHDEEVEKGRVSESDNIVAARNDFQEKIEKKSAEEPVQKEVKIERTFVEGEEDVNIEEPEEAKPALKMYYVGTTGKSAMVEKVANNKDDEDFGHSSSIVATDVAHSTIQPVIRDLHNPLKQRVRALERLGVQFTMFGEPMYRTVPEPSNN